MAKKGSGRPSFQIITSTRQGRETPRIATEFTSISTLLSSLKPGDVGSLWGTNIREELTPYATARGIDLRYGGGVLGLQRFSIRRRAAVYAPMYARSRYKVESFLSQSVPAKPVLDRGGFQIQYQDVFGLAASVGYHELVSYLEPFYYKSRRQKDGISDDISAYMSSFANLEVDGDIVYTAYPNSISFEVLIVLWLHYNRRGSGKLVLLSELSRPSWANPPSVAESKERTYLDVEQLTEAVAEYFNKPHKSVRTSFEIWSSGAPHSSRRLISKGVVTEQDANTFLTAFSLVTNDEAIVSLNYTVPEQQAAPLRFSASPNKISILEDRELSVLEPRVIGAAKTCLAALRDLNQYPVFSNTIPTFNKRGQRIDVMLQSIADGKYDDNLIVQLGTEIDGLEDRIDRGMDIISEDAAAESGAFFSLAKGFMSQFKIWGEYKRHAGEADPSGKAEPAAKQIFDLSQMRSDIMSGMAKERVSEYLTGVELNKDSEEVRAGSVLAAENLVAQAAGQIAEMAQKKKQPLSAEFAEKIVSTDGKVARWFVENKRTIASFARTANLPWLVNFIAALERKQN